MQIDVLANNTVKITLNRIDMTEYDVSFDSLSQKNPDTKRLLVELLTIIRLEKNLDLTDGRLFIEAFPKNDGGCMLYISCLKRLSEKSADSAEKAKKLPRQKPENAYKSQLICEVDGINPLIQLCVHLDTEKETFKSSIYSLDDKYRIILQDTAIISDKIFRITKEYGKIVGISSVLEAKTREHFSPVSVGNAVETIARTLGKRYSQEKSDELSG